MPPLLEQDSILSSLCLWDPKGIFSYFSARQTEKKIPTQYFVVVYTGWDKSFQYLLYLDVVQPQSQGNITHDPCSVYPSLHSLAFIVLPQFIPLPI